MKKIRTGNDVHIIWTITKNDEILESLDTLDLEGAEVLLIDTFNHPATFEYSITTIDESTAQVTGTFFGKDQKTQGKYRLLLVKNKGEEGMITLDFVDAFILTCVSKFGVMSGNDESSITTATIELDSQFSSYNGTPDMTGYFTKQECNDEFVHKSVEWARNNPGEETIYGNKVFYGIIDINSTELNLPAPDEIWLQNGMNLEEYIQSESSNVNIDNDTIKQNENEEIEAVNARLETSFDVQGVNIGGYSDGNTISAGTKVWQVIKTMLQKLLDVIAQVPTNTIRSTASTSTIYEVGTVLTPGLSRTYVDGKFVGQPGYDYEIAAGCEADTTTYQQRTGTSGAWSTATETKVLEEGQNQYRCQTTYGASTNIPVKNNGEASNVRIAAGSTDWSSVSFNSYYKYFVGCYDATTINELTSNIVRALNLTNGTHNSSGWCTGNSTTNSNLFTSDGHSIIIACPSTWKLNSIQNGLGASIIDNFSVRGTLTINIGGTSTNNYNIYIYPITNGAQVEFKNINLTK